MAINLTSWIEKGQCPLCTCYSTKFEATGDAYIVKCKPCGSYQIPVNWLIAITDKDIELLPYLSIHTRRASDRGEIVILESGTWKEIALTHSKTPVAVKASKLLELAAARSKPDASAKFDSLIDAPLVDACSPSEFNFLLEHLRDIGYLDNRGLGMITAKGWDQLQSVKTTGVSGKCFVAMSFHESLKDAYNNGIYPAIKTDCNMEPVRLDLVEHNEKICDKIIGEIRTCQFVVADVTMQRAGVYFEAGFAMGLGRPVIWSCQEDDLKNVHFDTRQYNHIVWKELDDLRIQLTNRIKATIPGAV